ncbi:FMN reductase (NADH) NtaB [Mycobacteroides salmoniphilum]|uniref:FMN reductase (NADH) NtaB n=2 Tax=Mycobacteroides salmoniphilum TaxID=404941 RepID=A0A4V3HYS1_9MYCO|nr:FMN reductase (NADH) NtaB [Mycobacteroides salmoniphilum]
MHADFASLMSQLDHPMYLATVQGAEGPSGCLVGFAGQVSIDPPLFLVCLSDQNHTWRVSHGASHLAVHVIPRANSELVRLFGETTGDRVNKFPLCSWRTGPHGVPILQDASAWFVGEIASRVELGDHVGHVLAPVAVCQTREVSACVTSRDVTHLHPGHEA